jgi:ComF family protein
MAAMNLRPRMFAAGLRAHVLAPLLEFALPQRCTHCEAPASARSVLCEPCLARIPQVPAALCATCLARGDAPYACLRHPHTQVASAWIYDDAAAAVVQALKYDGRPQLASALGGVLAGALSADARRADLVLEMPLHPARERERGYNQASVLADALAEAASVPRAPGAILRTRATAPQARLGQRERRQNVGGAFQVRHPARLRGRRVLVVDDVLTTGSTMQACLGALAEAGAEASGVTLAFAQ